MKKEKKYICKLCKNCVGNNTRWWHRKREPEIIRVKTDLFGNPIDEVFHWKCWKKFKIYD